MNENRVTKKKGVDAKFTVIAFVVVLVVVAALVAVFFKKGKITAHSSSREEIQENLEIDIKEPEDATDISYDIENEQVARVTYTKTFTDGTTMHLIMRSTSLPDADLINLAPEIKFSDQPIYMTTVCDDGTEIEVESFIALDNKGNMKYMKSLWKDNNKNCSMVTEDLTTREDFLREVNRLIIDNHISQ